MNYSSTKDRYDNMKYNRCGNSGIKLSAILLGLWYNFGSVDVYNNSRDILLTAFDNGITHFDLANNYECFSLLKTKCLIINRHDRK